MIVDIRKYPHVIDSINSVLSAGDDVQIEKRGKDITVLAYRQKHKVVLRTVVSDKTK